MRISAEQSSGTGLLRQVRGSRLTRVDSWRSGGMDYDSIRIGNAGGLGPASPTQACCSEVKPR